MSNEDATTAVPQELEDKPQAAVGDIDLDMLMDVPVTMTVEVGRKSLTIKELLSLTPGSVVSFDRSVTEPMDIMINGTLVARGEVVSADGKFGLRLVDVVSPKERLEQLS
ncbi:MAG: flagellar motor switch protein FliN [Gammaproteobacteria bacterium]|nr:flagellar motor switch protein FliN [Gammaproteobacteria bacterium]